MTKQQALKIIDESKDIYLNKDQKNLARAIINSVNEKDDVQGYLDFIMKRTGLGFKFDVAPDVAEGRIAVVNEMKDYRINVSDVVTEDENKLIIGENFEALKNLLLTHKEKIDIIYIDPPYNTESAKEDGNTSSKEGEASKFIYKDKFGRNGWLNMMRERLVLAKRLLSDDGVIFVSIDDTEQAYLKVLMDEIFGEENFISSTPRMTKTTAADSMLVGNQHEYTLFYGKNKHLVQFNLEEHEVDGRDQKDDHFTERGGYYAKHTLDSQSIQYGGGSTDFVIKWNNKEFYPGGSKEGFEKRKSGDFSMGKWCWGWSEKLVEWAIQQDAIIEKNGRIYIKNYSKLAIDKSDGDRSNKNYKWVNKEHLRAFRSLQWTNSEYSNEIGTKELKKIFDGKVFPNPKPVTLVSSAISLHVNKNATVLDFFAGSGTTGQAVLEANREDGGNRRFIICTNNENNIAVNATFERLHRIIVGKSSDGKSNFSWIKDNAPFIGTKLRTFNIHHYNVEVSDIEKMNEIKEEAVQNLQRLSKEYDKGNDLDVYYDLDGLNPYNEEQYNQEYSTDPLEGKK